MTYDGQGLIQAIDLDAEPREKEELPVYDDKDTGTSPLKDGNIWSFDATLAQIIDEAFTMMMNCDFYCIPSGMKEVRDTFRAYANKDNGDPIFPNPFEVIESDEYKALMDSLEWIKVNFTGLWT